MTTENIPKDLLYSKDHEWIKLDGDLATIGITHHAQAELGDIVFVELPEIDDEISEGDTIGTIEAVKTVADIYAPLSGTVVDTNSVLEDDSACMNTSPYEDGWIAVIKINSNTYPNDLLTSEQYLKLIE